MADRIGDEVKLRMTSDSQTKFQSIATQLNMAPLTVAQVALSIGLEAIQENPDLVVSAIRKKMKT